MLSVILLLPYVIAALGIAPEWATVHIFPRLFNFIVLDGIRRLLEKVLGFPVCFTVKKYLSHFLFLGLLRDTPLRWHKIILCQLTRRLPEVIVDLIIEKVYLPRLRET